MRGFGNQNTTMYMENLVTEPLFKMNEDLVLHRHANGNIYEAIALKLTNG